MGLVVGLGVGWGGGAGRESEETMMVTRTAGSEVNEVGGADLMLMEVCPTDGGCDGEKCRIEPVESHMSALGL